MTLDEHKEVIRKHFKENKGKYVEQFGGQIQFADWYFKHHVYEGNQELYLLDVDDTVYDFLLLLFAGEKRKIRERKQKEVLNACRQIVKRASRKLI